MKKIILSAIPLLIGILLLAGFKSNEKVKTSTSGNAYVIEIPENVKAVIDQACIECHSEASGNAKGKLRLTFDKFTNGDYSPGKIVGKLNNIIEVLDDGSMPPEKLLEKYPGKKLKKEQISILKDWANSNIQKISEE